MKLYINKCGSKKSLILFLQQSQKALVWSFFRVRVRVRVRARVGGRARVRVRVRGEGLG
jgi:hypothetical protein